MVVLEWNEHSCVVRGVLLKYIVRLQNCRNFCFPCSTSLPPHYIVRPQWTMAHIWPNVEDKETLIKKGSKKLKIPYSIIKSQTLKFFSRFVVWIVEGAEWTKKRKQNQQNLLKGHTQSVARTNTHTSIRPFLKHKNCWTYGGEESVCVSWEKEIEMIGTKTPKG